MLKPNFTPRGTRKRRANLKHFRASRRKGKTRVKKNKMENEITVMRFDEIKSCFFAKINKIDKTFARLTKKKRDHK